MDRFMCIELPEFNSGKGILREFSSRATRLFEIRDQNGNPCGVTASEELAAMLGCPSVQQLTGSKATP